MPFQAPYVRFFIIVENMVWRIIPWRCQGGANNEIAVVSPSHRLPKPILKYPVPSLSSCVLRKTQGQFPSGLLHHHMVPKIEGPCHIWVEGMLCLPLEVRMAKCRVDGRTPQACSLQEASPSSYLLRPLQLLLSPLLLLLLLLLLLRADCSIRVNNFVGGDLTRLLGHLVRIVLGI